MKKIFSLLIIVILFTTAATAQDYKTAVGLQIDFGDGSTLAGPAIKHFFNDKSAIEGEVLFGNHITYLQAFYHYQQGLPNAKNLSWYIGGGPSLGLYSGGSDFLLRPMVGLDYKVNGAPLALSFDWRPALNLGNNYGGSRFTAARFGIGIKYVLN